MDLKASLIAPSIGVDEPAVNPWSQQAPIPAAESGGQLAGGDSAADLWSAAAASGSADAEADASALAWSAAMAGTEEPVAAPIRLDAEAQFQDMERKVNVRFLLSASGCVVTLRFGRRKSRQKALRWQMSSSTSSCATCWAVSSKRNQTKSRSGWR